MTKCPICHEVLGSDLDVCPVCGHDDVGARHVAVSGMEEPGPGSDSLLSQPMAGGGITRRSRTRLEPQALSTPRPRPTPEPYGHTQNPASVGGAALEGIVESIRDEQAENPDPDYGQVFFGVLLALNVIVLAYTALLAALMALVVVAVLALIFQFRLPGVGLGGCLSMIPLIGLLFRGQARDRVPVTYIRVLPSRRGATNRFRVKGQLNHQLELKDRVRVWGPVRQGAVVFQRGQLLDPETGSFLPLQIQSGFRWGWWLLGALLILDGLALFAWLGGGQ